MKLVKSQHKHGCAIACLAMITGKTYKQVAAYLTKTRREDLNRAGMYDCEIEELAEDMGWHTTGFIYGFATIPYFVRKTKATCIVSFMPRKRAKQTYQHCVVYDADKRWFLDPEPPFCYKKELVTSVLYIWH